MMDSQMVLNVAFGLISFLGGWLFKLIFNNIDKIENGCDENNTNLRNDYRCLNDKINQLALSIPEKYVSKDDFNQLVKAVHHRFDRLEEKIDSLSENKKDK